MDFWIFLDFFEFWIFFWFFDLFDFLWFFEIFGFFLKFFWCFGIPFKVTKVTTKSYQGNLWTPQIVKKNMPKQHNKLCFAQKPQKPWPKAKALHRS